ncbi:pyridoxal phosphate-dependent transferase, partial [Gorgonomyces haynaldii]
VNLGQGFPTLPLKPFVKEACVNAINGSHQYTRSEGHPRLVHALAKLYSPLVGHEYDPLKEIVTTVGATEAIYSTIQAFIDRDDEVILMQPFYDSYPASIHLAGGKPVVVSLEPNGTSDWFLDMNKLEQAVTSRTKMLIINNPHNPIGKVFTRQELEQIAQFAEKHDLIVMADEVYETLVFDDAPTKMIKFASLPGMFKRTITVGSIGKMFGVTGWKVGWVMAPPELVRAVWMVHQFVPFSVATPMQEAAADVIEQAMNNDFFEQTRKEYQQLRDELFETLDQVGFSPMKPNGGYFIIADMAHVDAQGQDYSKFLTERAGVTPIPVGAFYDPKDSHLVKHLVRFAYCKDSATIQAGGKRLK